MREKIENEIKLKIQQRAQLAVALERINGEINALNKTLEFCADENTQKSSVKKKK